MRQALQLANDLIGGDPAHAEPRMDTLGEIAERMLSEGQEQHARALYELMWSIAIEVIGDEGDDTLLEWIRRSAPGVTQRFGWDTERE